MDAILDFLATFLLLLQRSLCFFSVITEKNAKRLKKVGRIIGILGFLYMGLFFCIEWINNPGDDERKLTLFGWGAFLLCTLSYWLDYHHLLKINEGQTMKKIINRTENYRDSVQKRMGELEIGLRVQDQPIARRVKKKSMKEVK